jgi:hypothetical protein
MRAAIVLAADAVATATLRSLQVWFGSSRLLWAALGD